MPYRLNVTLLVFVTMVSTARAEPPGPALTPLVRVVDLDRGQSQEVTLCDGRKVDVKLLDLRETTGEVRGAVRRAEVEVEVDGKTVRLVAGNYELPKTVGGVRIDCPITGGYVKNAGSDYWGLTADARLRLWPAGSPLVRPGTFVYPVRQRWFASATQMANQPCYVNACEDPKVRKIYYHYGLDFGGCEGMTEVVAATDGLVVSVGTERLPGFDDTPVKPRYDVVYILDARGWYYRYSHLFSIDETVKPGRRIRAGDPIGILGKEGGSGGWSHLHFDIHCRMPSGLWGCQEAYCFAWEAHLREHDPKLVAVARPHHVIWAGGKVTLDATRSYSAEGNITGYGWTFTDGTTANGAKIERTYAQPGYYSEIVKVTDVGSRIDYDFAIVHVLDREQPDSIPPTIHAVYQPTRDIKAGDEVTFKVRTFRTTEGRESWNFGDGTPAVTTRSDGNVRSSAKDGYAAVTHRYAKPGHYLVRVERTDDEGRRAVCHLQVRVGRE